MTRPRPKPVPIAIVWQAAERAPRGMRPWLARLLAEYLRSLGYPGSGLNLLVANDASLRALNARHRRRDRPTDILSFSYLDPRKSRRAAPPPGPLPRRYAAIPLLGELAVSWNRVLAQAKANGWDARTELARLLAHGCVHLLGYDHTTRKEDAAMRRIEERLLAGAGIKGIYPGI